MDINDGDIRILGTAGTVIEFTRGPSEIVFHAGDKVALRITRDGITANPDVPVDEAAKAIFAALQSLIAALKS